MYISKLMGNQVGERVFRDILPFVYSTHCKTKFGQNHQKIFSELDQSPKTNLGMFKFDNKLI